MARRLPTKPASVATTPWTNQAIELFHGTILAHKDAILAGVDIAAGRTALDFGQGFYTTTNLDQARTWARQRARDSRLKGQGANPVVVRFVVSRDELAGLEWVGFVRGTVAAVDYWSLVIHCLSRGVAHGRAVPVAHSRAGWYDVAIGPVSAWPRHLCFPDFDQISFHTQPAADVMNASTKGVV